MAHLYTGEGMEDSKRRLQLFLDRLGAQALVSASDHGLEVQVGDEHQALVPATFEGRTVRLALRLDWPAKKR